MAEVSGAQSPTVLIVDENDDSRVELRKLLGRAGLDVAGEARYGANAAAAAYQLQPAVILVGVDEPPNRALETIERLTQLLLETPIIAYSSMDEAGAIRRATRAGVRDYLTRPIDPDTLRESVLSVLAHEERLRNRRAGGEAPPPHGTIITVTGAKGGVGKSVVAINLALGLRQVTGHSVALLDADTHFGDVAMMLNLPADPPVTRSIGRVDTLDRETVVDQTVLHPSGIRILPGPAEPDGWEEVAPEQLERFIHLLAEAFDFVIIDTPDRFDHVVQQCVQSATLTMLVSSLDISSIADTKVALRLMHRWDYPPEKVRLTVNRTRKGGGITEKHVTQALNWPIFCSVPYDKYVPEMHQLGQSPVLSAPKSQFARTFRELAGAVSGSGTSTIRADQQVRKRRFFGLLPAPEVAG